MPMETNTSMNIRPIQRPTSSQGSESVNRRGDGGASSSAFSPRTNVSIKNAVSDMAGILSKISTMQEEGMEEMPKDLQKLVQNIMRQAFSMEETLSQGIGSTLESQRFSMEQMNTLARILNQMGSYVENGGSLDIGSDLQAFFSNLKSYLTGKEGNSIEPVLLNKMSFELLDTKSLQDLPQVLQMLLSQMQMSAGTQLQQQGNDESLAFMKQLMRFFMPQSNTASEGGQAAQSQGMPSSQASQSQGMPSSQATQSQGMPSGQATQSQGMPSSQAAQPQGMPSGQAAQSQGMPSSQAFQPQGMQEGQAPQSQGMQEGYMPQQSGKAQFQESMTMAQQAKQQMLQTPMQNTPQVMDTMKSLAQLLLKDAQMTEQDTALLQNFVNGKEAVLGEKQAKQLQSLLKLCQLNIPASVQQMAVQQNLPDMPRLWAFMQLCDLAFARKMTGKQLKKASKSVSEFAYGMRQSMAGQGTASLPVQGQKSLNFMMPLYLGENEKSYPSYIHVYDEDTQDPYTGEQKRETWLRLCVLTDYVGAVELTCRVYDGAQLDMRVFFSADEAAKEFREYVPELEESMKDTGLFLANLRVGASGERRFL